MKIKIGGILAVGALMMAGSVSSYADIIISLPGSSANTENISFVNGASGTHLTGTSTPSGFQLDVEGSSTLGVSGNTVSGAIDQTFFVIEPLNSGQYFTKLRFNLVTAGDGTVSFNTATGTIVGPTTFTVAGGNAGNVFTFEATNNQTLNSLTISSVNNLGLTSLKNINAGFADVGVPPTSTTPEPGTIALLGAGLVGVGLLKRKLA